MSLTTKVIAEPGFSDQVSEAQNCFRVILDAFSRPGIVKEMNALPPNINHSCPLSKEAMQGFLAIALSLCDADTPVWLDGNLQCQKLKQHLRFHCASPLVDLPEKAAFAFISNLKQMPELARFCQGSPAYPDSSTTMIIAAPFACEDSEKAPYILTGPGIKKDEAPLRLPLVAEVFSSSFWAQLQENHAGYPLGVDIIFVNTAKSSRGMVQIFALPRSVSLKDI